MEYYLNCFYCVVNVPFFDGDIYNLVVTDGDDRSNPYITVCMIRPDNMTRLADAIKVKRADINIDVNNMLFFSGPDTLFTDAPPYKDKDRPLRLHRCDKNGVLVNDDGSPIVDPGRGGGGRCVL